MHVFAYGSLMYPEVWRAVAGRSFETVPGNAPGFAVYRVRDAEFPGIVAADGDASVPGVVHLDVDDAALARLDRFEDDFYRRQLITIRCDDGQEREAYAYIVPAENGDILTDEPWSGEQFVAQGGLRRFQEEFAGFGRVDDA